jgi:Glycosyltransferase like family
MPVGSTLRPMIAFGSSMTSPEAYERFAKPGIARAAEPDSEVFAYQAAGSISRSYNLMLDKAAAQDDLEALVLVHQDAEIIDPDFCSKLRQVLGDPEVGVVGCVGAVGARSIAWWEGSVTGGSAVYRYGELGGGEMAAVAWGGDQTARRIRPGEVETLDGFMLALSPWTVRNLRFDESLGQLYGHDFDFCVQVRAAGKRVVTADLKVAHHHSLDLVIENEPWVSAHIRVAEKWDGSMPGRDAAEAGDDWKQRARRAEAEAAVARLLVRSKELQRDAQAAELDNRLEHVIGTKSWRITEPLRRLNAIWQARRGERD